MKELESASNLVYRRFFDIAPLAMVLARAADGILVDANRAFLELFGWKRGEAVGRPLSQLGLFVQPARQRDFGDALARDGRLREAPVGLRRRDGRVLECLYSAELVEAPEGKLVLASMSDASEPSRLRSELARANERLGNALSSACLGAWEWNIQTGECAFDERWAAIVGYGVAELGKQTIDTWTRLTHPDDLAESGRRLQKLFSGASDGYEFESRARKKDGSWIWVLDRGRILERDALGQPLLMAGTRADISERHAFEERLREAAIRDELTGLFNRRYVFERLDALAAEYLRKRRDFCVSIVDLDRFKSVNEERGHLAGDEALAGFARVLASSVRPYDLVGRHAGEEFIVVSVNANLGEASAVIARLKAAVGATGLACGGRPLDLTFSCGVAAASECPPGEFSVEALVDAAERRLSRAKEGGRDRIVMD